MTTNSFSKGDRVNVSIDGTEIPGVIAKRYTRGGNKGLFDVATDDGATYEHVDPSMLTERKRGRKSLASTLSPEARIERGNALKAELSEKPTRGRQKAIRREMRSLGFTGGVNAVIE